MASSVPPSSRTSAVSHLQCLCGQQCTVQQSDQRCLSPAVSESVWPAVYRPAVGPARSLTCSVWVCVASSVPPSSRTSAVSHLQCLGLCGQQCTAQQSDQRGRRVCQTQRHGREQQTTQAVTVALQQSGHTLLHRRGQQLAHLTADDRRRNRMSNRGSSIALVSCQVTLETRKA